VISKLPIVKAVEYDSSPDGYEEAFSHKGSLAGVVSEKELSSTGIKGFGEPLAKTDRGTMWVDLANGPTIFPLHLKSNRNEACQKLEDAVKTLRRFGLPVPANANSFLQKGFARATAEHVANAKKRERVMAATVRVANEAAGEGRIVVIAGDLNTSFEPGKFGNKVSDCTLTDFSCAKAPFAASACRGDGYDDTLGMLEEGLVGDFKWKVLSRGLRRTYSDKAFGDFAIDHIAVPVAHAASFSPAHRALELYGSDHFPIFATFNR
jgi:hypothetical protein